MLARWAAILFVQQFSCSVAELIGSGQAESEVAMTISGAQYCEREHVNG